MKGYLTTKEVAERLGITSTRVRQLIIAKQMKAEWVGMIKLVPEKEVQRFEQLDRPPGRPSKPKRA